MDPDAPTSALALPATSRLPVDGVAHPTATDRHIRFGDVDDPWADAGSETAEPPAAMLEHLVEAVVERLEQRVVDELERRGRLHRWGGF